MIHVYVDGSLKKNNVGGWAYIILQDVNDNGTYVKMLENRGGVRETTNNQMEMLAPIKALDVCATFFKGKDVKIFCDSAYIVNAFLDDWFSNWRRNGWKNAKGKEVANRGLWEVLLKQVSAIAPAKVEWVKVKGHDGVQWNEECDKLAQMAAQELKDEDEVKAELANFRASLSSNLP